MLTNKLAADIPSQDGVIDVTNNTSETRKSKFTKAKLVAPPLERFHAELNQTKRTASSTELGVHFKIVETGGISMRSILQRSNPLQTIGCDNGDCLPCKMGRGAGGDCEGGGINYEI